MKSRIQQEEAGGPDRHFGRPPFKNTTTTPPSESERSEESSEASQQTAEPDGQFPENPRGTLDDQQPGEDGPGINSDETTTAIPRRDQDQPSSGPRNQPNSTEHDRDKAGTSQ